MANQKLWGGRFSMGAAEILDTFNASLPFDKKLYKQDILGSKIHAQMLAKCGILTQEEANLISKGLEQVKSEIENGTFKFIISDEDIHLAIEKRLIEIIGEVGKKLHTARSRNDQVALDFRLFVLDSNKHLRFLVLNLITTLLNIARDHTQSMLPGMTHLQHAQPINFGFLLCAYACMFVRDFERLESSYQRNNYCPLGAAALAGTPYDTDRYFVAKQLGFTAPMLNATDSVSDRDFALDFLYDTSLLIMHISRLAEELVLWSSYEFKFITLSDAYSTGSSIMPQKKNPDVPELLRGKSGRVYGNLMSLLVVMKGLPLAYNKDTQEDKERVFDSFETLEISLRILNSALETMTIHTDFMLKACRVGHLSATDLADFLVQHCRIPFREAHHITGKAVAYAETLQKDLSELSVEELCCVDSRIPKEAHKSLDLKASMESRNSYGGTSTQSTLVQIESLEAWLNLAKNTLEEV
ncbi:argininosuccinate lyase [Helicobacter turcicus]|uniref:Argininosuccinate lyase n=1 Tax=Helicobacter turcicus TaxID=2867412 RepID=A0ABS7JKU0_9HELI|nr:argininosuccinate lyase [Helicobacter turcicus]MBX7490010.1 argininosuccinate lyase [Helicobacter turcicus]MBX7544869.1 argininosuccinate lyase [Helicobacter turcicus]